MASLLPLPDDPRFPAMINELWPAMQGMPQLFPYPRSAWLGIFEGVLQELVPQSSSRDRKLTARHYAPFTLAAGKDAP